jgi:hypothetical protein
MEEIMKKFDLAGGSLKAELIACAGALLATIVSLGSVLVLFASASGELEPIFAKAKPAPASSAVAGGPAHQKQRG